MTGSAKGASTWRAGATPVAIASAAATSAVAGSGIASVIHHAMARVRIGEEPSRLRRVTPGVPQEDEDGERRTPDEPGRLQAALEPRLEVRGGHGGRLYRDNAQPRHGREPGQRGRPAHSTPPRRSAGAMRRSNVASAIRTSATPGVSRVAAPGRNASACGRRAGCRTVRQGAEPPPSAYAAHAVSRSAATSRSSPRPAGRGMNLWLPPSEQRGRCRPCVRVLPLQAGHVRGAGPVPGG